MNNVICIGSALKDIFLPTGDGTVTETPQELLSKRKITFELGAKYRIEKRYTAAGGVALNVAIGLTRLGVPATPNVIVGGDATGMWLRDVLVKNNVDTSMVRQASCEQSDLSMILVDRKTGERVIFVNHGLQETLTVDTHTLGNDTVIFVSGLTGRTEENYSAIMRAVRENGCTLAYNPGQSNLNDNMDMVRQMVAQTRYLFINKDEAMQIVAAVAHDVAQLDDPVYVMTQLRACGAQTIVMTAGMKGAWMYDAQTMYHIPSSGARPVDTTGAGDAFTSGALAALLRDEAPDVACAWGAANAERVIQFYGSNEGLLALQMMRAQEEVFVPKVTRL